MSCLDMGWRAVALVQHAISFAQFPFIAPQKWPGTMYTSRIGGSIAVFRVGMCLAYDF